MYSTHCDRRRTLLSYDSKLTIAIAKRSKQTTEAREHGGRGFSAPTPRDELPQLGFQHAEIRLSGCHEQSLRIGRVREKPR